MAYTTYTPPTEAMVDQVNAITRAHFDKVIRQVVYEDSPLLKRLQSKHKVKLSGGNIIQWPARVEKLGQAGAVDPREPVTWDTADTRIGAQLNWKFYFAKTLIQWDELLKNKGEEQIIDLIKDKVTELKEDFQDLLIADLFATTSDEMKINPLNVVVGTDPYAGIDPDDLGDPTRWQSQVDESTTVLSLFGTEAGFTGNSLAAMVNKAKFGSSKPTLGLTTDEIFTMIEGMLDVRHQIRDEGMAKLGFDNIVFKGMTIVSDPHCPEKAFFGLDENELELVVHEDYDAATTPWKPHEDYPNALFKGLSWAGNLKSRTRHTHFKMLAIEQSVLAGPVVEP